MQIATICHFYLCFLVLPVEDALTDGVPMVIFSGQVPTGAMGTDAFQEWTGDWCWKSAYRLLIHVCRSMGWVIDFLRWRLKKLQKVWTQRHNQQ